MSLLFSCKKKTVTNTVIQYDTVGPITPPKPYYIQATINGTPIKYTVNASAFETVGRGLSVSGSQDTSSTSDYLTITFAYLNEGVNTAWVIPGVYTDTASNFLTGVQTNPYGLWLQQTYAGKYYYEFYDDADPVSTVFTSTITTVNDSIVRGTFSGMVPANNPGDPPTVVTNGSFYVSF